MLIKLNYQMPNKVTKKNLKISTDMFAKKVLLDTGK